MSILIGFFLYNNKKVKENWVMLELIVGTLLAIGVLMGGIKMVELYDKDGTLDLEVGLFYYLLCGIGVFVVWRNLEGADFWFLSLLVGYLVLTAYTDIKTLLIYSMFNFVFFIVGIIYSIIEQAGKELVFMMIGAVVVFKILGKLKVYGEGDSEIFAVASVFLMNLSNRGDYWYHLMWLVFIASVVSLILGMARIKVTKENLRTKMPFAPGIGISVMVMMYLFL